MQPTFKRFKNRLVQQFMLTLIASVLRTVWEILFAIYWTRLRVRFPALNLPPPIPTFTKPPRTNFKLFAVWVITTIAKVLLSLIQSGA